MAQQVLCRGNPVKLDAAQKLPANAVAKDVQPTVLSARSTPGPLPLQITAKKVELAEPFSDAHLENLFD